MKRKSFLKVAIAVICGMAATHSYAQKPQWVGNTPKELNHTYKFVEITSYGSSLESARADAKDRLTDDSQLQEGIRVYRKTWQHTQIDKQRSTDRQLQETIRDHIDIDVTVDGEKFDLQAVNVDEYAENQNGHYTLHTLYMVALCDNPVFDRTYLTTSYGFAPVAMSVIPGLGQWYKGSKIKGGSMFVTEALAVTGIIICDNQKASYIKKMKEQPNFTLEYNSKADNWETGRNICIGVAAGIWLYNIIDAAVAKGGRRVNVQRADGSGLSLMPFTSSDAAGLSLAYKF